jgi:hypothetical protein
LDVLVETPHNPEVAGIRRDFINQRFSIRRVDWAVLIGIKK